MLKDKKTLIALLLIPQYFFVKFIGNYPEFIEHYYSNGFYIYISKMFRFFLGWLPFSFGDLFYAAGIIYILRWFVKNWKRIKTDTKHWFTDVFSAVSVLYFAFHLFWGFNYYRLPLHTSLNLNYEYTTEQLIKVTEQLLLKANALHLEIAKNDSTKVDIPLTKTEILKLAPDGYLKLKQIFPDLEYSPRSV